jgi:hypothetical protein
MNTYPMTKNLSDNDVNFDHNHYSRVYSYRTNKGENLKHTEDNVTEMEDFQVKENTPIYDSQKDRYIYIQSVHKHWNRGWYYVILYYTFYKNLGNISKSHGVLYIRNINCHDKIILNSIKKNSERFIIPKLY